MNTAETELDRLLGIMERLRASDGGCPWDREQTFATIAPYTIEEAYEVADAIANGSPERLRSELGDLLFQVVFHARLAEEQGWFAFGDVAASIADKLTTRHPHVFADARFLDAAGQTAAWEAMKAKERDAGGLRGTLADVPLALPALTRAAKLAGAPQGSGSTGRMWQAHAPRSRRNLARWMRQCAMSRPNARQRNSVTCFLPS